MVLVDTSVWIDHFRRADPNVMTLIEQWNLVQHPMVVGELALGSLARRNEVLASLAGLRAVTVASHDEVMTLVETKQLFGTGISLVDAHLLASTLLTPGTALWTKDKSLRSAADRLGLSYQPGS